VTVQVIRSLMWASRNDQSLTILSFAKRLLLSCLRPTSSVFLDKSPDTLPFQQAIQSLTRVALGRRYGRVLIAIAAEYERG